MGLFSKDFHTLDDLFVHTLLDIYYAENRIVEALPDMIEKAFEPQLIQAFKSHLLELLWALRSSPLGREGAEMAITSISYMILAPRQQQIEETPLFPRLLSDRLLRTPLGRAFPSAGEAKRGASDC